MVAGIFLAVGLLLHQKAVLLLVLLAGLVLLRPGGAGRTPGAGRWRMVVCLLGPTAAALSAIAAWYHWQGALGDYLSQAWAYNWLTVGRSPHRGVSRFVISLAHNAPFWAAACAGAVDTMLRSGDRHARVPRTLAVMAASLLAMLLAVGRPVDQYLLPVLPLFAVMAAAGLSTRASHRKGGMALLATTAAVIVLPAALMAGWVRPAHGPQFERLAFVHDLVPPGVPVYDGDNRFNLFRPDVHHRWFSIGRAPETAAYNRLGPPAHVPYDGCAAIRRARPRVTSDFRIDLDACELTDSYRAADFGLWLARR
jgi:hypothetical protein